MPFHVPPQYCTCVVLHGVAESLLSENLSVKSCIEQISIEFNEERAACLVNSSSAPVARASGEGGRNSEENHRKDRKTRGEHVASEVGKVRGEKTKQCWDGCLYKFRFFDYLKSLLDGPGPELLMWVPSGKEEGIFKGN
jgi:hypothetical protein